MYNIILCNTVTHNENFIVNNLVEQLNVWQ